MHASSDRNRIALYRSLYRNAAANRDHVTASAHHVDGATDTNDIADLLVLLHHNTSSNLDTVALRTSIKRAWRSNQHQQCEKHATDPMQHNPPPASCG